METKCMTKTQDMLREPFIYNYIMHYTCFDLINFMNTK